LDYYYKFNNCKKSLAGGGTQTAGLAFGGLTHLPVNSSNRRITGAFLSAKKITTS
jgi:hypothetical protein